VRGTHTEQRDLPMRGFPRVLAALLAIVLLSTPRPTFAQPQPMPGAWLAGPGAMGDNTYVGAIDAPAAGATVSPTALLTVSGWFVDTSAEGWAGADDVRVFLGTMDTGLLLGHATIGLSRPDIAATLKNPFWATAGFQAAVDPGPLASGPDTLTVYAHTPAKGWWSLQVGVVVVQTVSSNGEPIAAAPALLHGGPPVVTVSTPTENEIISIHNRSFPITGTAAEATSGPRGIDWVEVWLNGEANSDNATILGVADLNGDGTWSLPFDPGSHLPIDSNLYVYAHSALNGKKSLVVRHFFLADRPL
jgi:hypothetical protein